MPSPEGYRKTMRLMRQAEKFHRPVICFVDTPGAFCGIEAEEGGIGEAIARNLYEMSSLKVPILSIMIGEGGSGGAIAMAVGNDCLLYTSPAENVPQRTVHYMSRIFCPLPFFRLPFHQSGQSKETGSCAG